MSEPNPQVTEPGTFRNPDAERSRRRTGRQRRRARDEQLPDRLFGMAAKARRGGYTPAEREYLAAALDHIHATFTEWRTPNE